MFRALGSVGRPPAQLLATCVLSGCSLVMPFDELTGDPTGTSAGAGGQGGAGGLGGAASGGSGGHGGAGGLGLGGAGGTASTSTIGAGGTGGTASSSTTNAGGTGGTVSTSATGAGGMGGTTSTSTTGTGGSGGAGSCMQDAKQCAGLVPQTCDEGVWQGTIPCPSEHGTPSCAEGVCSIACESGHGDCDADVANGCETDTSASTAHCGACGTTCLEREDCIGGTCVPPSCVGGATGQVDCGPGSESCCTSLLVPGGTVQLDATHSTTVSAFKLDKYEITVGRFRRFVDAWVGGGWRPSAWSGVHAHLKDGALNNGKGGHESGWDPSWENELPASKSDWNYKVSCNNSTMGTWTSLPESNERLPINCTTWFEQYAFCIWDGGFLPSEAEWQYAAAGGDENRKYPWGPLEPDNNAKYAIYGCYWNAQGTCTNTTNNIAPVGSASNGNGRWGHSDLAGSVWEWTLDWQNGDYPLATTVDYTNTTAASDRTLRGGGYTNPASDLTAARRGKSWPIIRLPGFGARCARSP